MDPLELNSVKEAEVLRAAVRRHLRVTTAGLARAEKRGALGLVAKNQRDIRMLEDLRARLNKHLRGVR